MDWQAREGHPLFLASIVLIAAAAVLLAACASQPPASTDAPGKAGRVFRFAHHQPVETPLNKGAIEFSRLVKERTHGAIEIQVFPNSQLGGLTDQIEAVRMGTIDFGMSLSSLFGQDVPIMQAFDLPFLFPSEKAYYATYNSKLADEILAKMSEKGWKGLAFWTLGFKQLTSNKKITRPEDLRGLKWRVVPSPIVLEQFKAWGTNPVTIEYSELFMALQQGVVDGQENSLAGSVPNRLYEAQKYMMLTRHGAMQLAIFTNQKLWDSLPAEHQDIVLKTVREVADYVKKLTEEQETLWLKQVKDHGTQVIEFSPQQIEAFAAPLLPLHARFAGVIGAEFLARLKAHIESVQ